MPALAESVSQRDGHGKNESQPVPLATHLPICRTHAVGSERLATTGALIIVCIFIQGMHKNATARKLLRN